MPDRIDIDALLIGALYGELTPADEALLAAHLESHPADRTALADLTRTRAAVRDSRLLAVQLEPPQAISALLLQEASRRAPRPSARDRETASWFQRFVRSFMVHPAMAAAAMLVLVVGVAGTLYLSGIHQFAETAPPKLPPQASAAQGVAPLTPETAANTTPPTGAAAAAPVPEPEAAQVGDRAAAGSAASAGVVAGPAGYRVDLDDTKARLAAAQQDALSARAAAEKTKAGLQVDGRAAEGAQAAQAPKQVAALPPAEPADTRNAKPTKSDKKIAGIVVRTPEPSPRELKESAETDDEAPRRPSLDGERDVVAATATGRITRGAGSGAPGGGGAAAAPAAAPAPPAAVMPAPPSVADQAGSQPAPAFEPGAAGKKAASKAKTEAKNDAKTEAPRPVAKPAPAKPRQRVPTAAPSAPPANDSNRFAGKVADPAKDNAGADKAVDRSVIDWARKRHEQVKTLVSSNNCRAAASAATEIYNRAPDYYAANVVTDRTIKPCLPYLNTEREREDRVRAAKNAAASDSAAPAPPPARK